MKKQIYIKPRQTGKTHNAINVFERCNGNKLYVCYNSGNIQDILAKSKINRMDITFYDAIKPELFMGKEFDLIVLDEFMFSRKQVALYKIITANQHRIKQLYMCSTPSATIPQEMFDYIIENKGVLPGKVMLNHCMREFWIDERNFDYWFYNFITDKDSNLIFDDFLYTGTDETMMESHLGTEAYELYIKNKMIL